MTANENQDLYDQIRLCLAFGDPMPVQIEPLRLAVLLEDSERRGALAAALTQVIIEHEAHLADGDCDARSILDDIHAAIAANDGAAT